jgi:xanthine dehydrogenase accessory factor
MKELIPTIRSNLAKGRHIVLVTIVKHSGSTPRESGAAMLMTASGRRHGSIGGGQLEAAAEEAARQALADGSSRFLNVDLTNQTAAEEGMVCGGRVELLIDCIQPRQETQELFAALEQQIGTDRGGRLVRAVFGQGSGIERIERCLMTDAGIICGHSPFGQEMLDTLLALDGTDTQLMELPLDRARLFIEPLQAAEKLYLFGAGHVSQAVATLAGRLDFHLTVLDDRADFASRQRFPTAEDIRVLDDFHEASAGLAIDRRSYLLILTRGHSFDQVVLAQALRSPAGYIGMIGSRRKREAIFRSLREEGFTDADLSRVHCPVGYAIGAETPEEIAVSIAAELIAVRRGAVQ